MSIKFTSFTTQLLTILFLCITFFTSITNAQEKKWYDGLPHKSWSKLKQLDSVSSWFNVYEIAPNSYAISAPYHWQETVSYLFVGDDKALLIDTGMAIGDLKAETDKLTDKPIIVINSHSHYDHVSNNHQYDTIYARDLDFTRNHSNGHPHSTYKNAIQQSAIWKNLPDGFSFEKYENKGFDIDKYVSDGEIIDLGNREIKIIFTPGHTPDSVLLYDKRERLLATGDTFYPSTLWAHRADAVYKDYLASAKLMAEMEKDVDFILPGHGETMIPSYFLTRLYKSVLSIRDPKTPYTLNDNIRRYQFDGFAMLVKNPPE